MDRLALIREFTAKYRARIVLGLATYGEFDPATDTRRLSHEAIEECLDIGSYLEMLEQKHPVLERKIQRIRAKTILLYGELKRLEAEEGAL
jgi:hypothetical protein